MFALASKFCLMEIERHQLKIISNKWLALSHWIIVLLLIIKIIVMVITTTILDLVFEYMCMFYMDIVWDCFVHKNCSTEECVHEVYI